MKVVTIYVIPSIILFIISFGVIKGVKIYEAFIEGAKEGLEVCKRIFPYLLAMIFAVTVIRESNLMDLFVKGISPITTLFNVPPEVMPLIMVKPLSGSGALGIFTEIINTYGADTFIGICASIIMGSTETIFYTISVYYGSVGIKKIRHTLWAAIMVDLIAIIMAVTITGMII